MMAKYPDISDILKRKAEGRKDFAARTFGQKIAMVEAMRERLAPLKRMREKDQAEREQAKANQNPDGQARIADPRIACAA